MQDIKPTGKYRKSYEAGFRAGHNGDGIKTNPNHYCPDVAMSSWWDAGWLEAQRQSIGQQAHKERLKK